MRGSQLCRRPPHSDRRGPSYPKQKYQKTTLRAFTNEEPEGISRRAKQRWAEWEGHRWLSLQHDGTVIGLTHQTTRQQAASDISTEVSKALGYPQSVEVKPMPTHRTVTKWIWTPEPKPRHLVLLDQAQVAPLLDAIVQCAESGKPLTISWNTILLSHDRAALNNPEWTSASARTIQASDLWRICTVLNRGYTYIDDPLPLAVRDEPADELIKNTLMTSQTQHLAQAAASLLKVHTRHTSDPTKTKPTTTAYASVVPNSPPTTCTACNILLTPDTLRLGTHDTLSAPNWYHLRCWPASLQHTPAHQFSGFADIPPTHRFTLIRECAKWQTNPTLVTQPKLARQEDPRSGEQGPVTTPHTQPRHSRHQGPLVPSRPPAHSASPAQSTIHERASVNRNTRPTHADRRTALATKHIPVGCNTQPAPALRRADLTTIDNFKSAGAIPTTTTVSGYVKRGMHEGSCGVTSEVSGSSMRPHGTQPVGSC